MTVDFVVFNHASCSIQLIKDNLLVYVEICNVCIAKFCSQIFLSNDIYDRGKIGLLKYSIAAELTQFFLQVGIDFSLL
ncbi:hypothetical protein BI380_12755 [Delftia tsuruhatensis]|uniref:Uncharacterized protein n=1 Tax=Delftia tsuruhatensis TaxID=180282 RepID=A0ABN4SI32_9BURK|nr:hypothetical protein BI380_12755 [Delftia tsuruhatensis]